jgi:hypothetical protein
MSDLDDEIENNFKIFSTTWQDSLQQAIKSLDAQTDKFLASYKTIASLNAWREHLITQAVSEEASLFFLEAQNDALISHVLARMGSWRSALKALRSCVENILYCLYYSDHPVELRQWLSGDHKLQFSELHAYFSTHPDLKDMPSDLSALGILKQEYGTLSRAVHGSAKGFRMTKGTDSTVLWNPDIPSLGAWKTREQAVLSALNILLLAYFRSHLQGTSRPALRAAIALTISISKYSTIQSQLGVHLS